MAKSKPQHRKIKLRAAAELKDRLAVYRILKKCYEYKYIDYKDRKILLNLVYLSAVAVGKPQLEEEE